MFYAFLLVASLVLTVEAALFLALGNLALSPVVIANLSSTRIGYSPPMIKSMASHAANTWAGVILLLLAFLLQAWSLLLGASQDELGAADRCGFWIGAVAAALVGAATWVIARIYAARIEAQALAHAQEQVADERG